MSTKVDYIITGFGLAGATIAWQLMRRGKTLAVFDNPQDNRSSSQAAGLFNPVSGKKMTKAWMADELFPYLRTFYTDVEKGTRARFFHSLPIYIPFRGAGEQNDWVGKTEMSNHIEKVFTSAAFGDQVHDELGGLLLSSGGYLHVRQYLEAMHRMISSKHVVRNTMDVGKLHFGADKVEYEDIVADRLIFCDGLAARKNPHTAWLPIRPLKGESIDIVTETELRAIYNRGIYIVPTGKGYYKAGATYERTEVPGTTISARRDLEDKLKALLRVPFSVTSQDWGIRPTVPDRRPVLGKLPDQPRAIIFNGLGTKGLSLAPYFSKVLADHLEHGGQIPQEVNISRFYTLSSRSAD